MGCPQAVLASQNHQTEPAESKPILKQHLRGGRGGGLENQAQNLLWRSRTTARLKQLQLSREPWASSKRRGGGRGGEARGLADLGTLTCTPAQAASSGALHAALSRPKRWALLPGALAPSSPISPSPAWEAPGPKLPSLAAKTRTEGVAKNCCSALFRGAGQRPPSHMGPLEGGAQPGLACAPPPPHLLWSLPQAPSAPPQHTHSCKEQSGKQCVCTGSQNSSKGNLQTTARARGPQPGLGTTAWTPGPQPGRGGHSWGLGAGVAAPLPSQLSPSLTQWRVSQIKSSASRQCAAHQTGSSEGPAVSHPPSWTPLSSCPGPLPRTAPLGGDLYTVRGLCALLSPSVRTNERRG